MALSAVSSMAQIWTNRPLSNLVSSLLAEVGRFISHSSLRRVNLVYEIVLMAQHDPLNILFFVLIISDPRLPTRYAVW